MPRGRNPRYVDQVLTVVKDNGIILQREVAKMFNMKYASGLENSVKRLVDNNRIKRTKVKMRFQNGNLNEAWLLYLPSIDYNLILEFEKKLINQPYNSPLTEHHCYKKDAETVDNVAITELVENHSNVIDMADYVRVNNTELAIKEFNGERVVSVKDIATLHHKELKHVNEVFKNNLKYFKEGEHFFIIRKNNSEVVSTDFKNLFNSNRQKEAFLFTEKGYLKLVKPFKDDLSWNIQDKLIDTYFKMKQLSLQNEIKPIPTGQVQSLDIMQMMIKELKKDRERVDQIEQKLNKIVNILSN